MVNPIITRASWQARFETSLVYSIQAIVKLILTQLATYVILDAQTPGFSEKFGGFRVIFGPKSTT